MKITGDQWHNSVSREAILRYIEESKPSFIDLSQAEIGDYGLRELLDVIGNNDLLESLFLDGNNISYYGIAILRDFILTNRSIKTLSLNNNFLSYFGAIEISWMIADNNNLFSLSIDNCLIDSSGMGQIILALAQNSNLDNLSVNCNVFSAENARSLINVLNYNQSICNIRYPHHHLKDSELDYVRDISDLLEKNLNHLENIPEKILQKSLNPAAEIKFTLRQDEFLSFSKHFQITLNKVIEDERFSKDFREALADNIDFIITEVHPKIAKKISEDFDLCANIVEAVENFRRNKNGKNQFSPRSNPSPIFCSRLSKLSSTELQI